MDGPAPVVLDDLVCVQPALLPAFPLVERWFWQADSGQVRHIPDLARHGVYTRSSGGRLDGST